jgi:glutathione S-transferase
MKFYDNAVAPSPRRVRMFMAEKGVEAERIEIDIRNGEQFASSFKAVNPFCTVPVLELDDGTRLITTDGCWAWLEEAWPDPPLLGRSAAEKGRIADTLHIVMFHGMMAVSEALRNSMEQMVDRGIVGPDNYAQIPALAERGRTRAAKFLDRLDGMIGKQPFVCGDIFTAADIDAFIYVTFAKWADINPTAGHRNVKRWYAEVESRPSASV